MADDQEIQFKLDLDSSLFAEGAQQALDLLGQLGQTDSINSLVANFAELGLIVGAAGLAVFAFKEALDLTLQGEEIERVEKQFRQLTEGAGVSGEALRAGLAKASGGLIDMNTLLQAASEGVVRMGQDSMNLVPIMEIARKATVLFGGDLLSNFNNITMAIENGNTRMLKRYGIIVDAADAEKEFAKSLGVTVDELSDAGKRQADMTAALDAAQERFKGVTPQVGETKTAYQQFKVAVTETKDALSEFVSKLASPALSGAFSGMGKWLHEAAVGLKDWVSGGTNAAAHAEHLTNLIADQREKVQELQHAFDTIKDPYAKVDIAKRLEQARQQLLSYTTQLHETASVAAASAKTEQAAIDGVAAKRKAANNAGYIDEEKRAKNQLKFDQEVTKSQTALVKAQEQNLTTVDQVDKLITAQAEQRAQAHATALKKINQEYADDSGRRKKLTALENQRFENQEETEHRKVAQDKIKMDQQVAANSKSAWQGMSAEFTASSAQASLDLMNFQKQGQMVFQAFQTESTVAFEAMGQAIAQQQNVAQAATKAIKSMFLSMIGDICEAEGKQILASSIFPPAPAGIAAGGALITLGAALKSMAGSTSGSGTPSVSGGTSSGGGPTAQIPATAGQQSQLTGASTADQQQMSQQQQVQRSVNINIAGHYLNTSESQRTLMQIMRNETDSTGFSYNSIGV